jgi:hypothetical protein
MSFVCRRDIGRNHERSHKNGGSFFVLSIIAVLQWAPVSAQETAGQILEKLSKLPPEKRQQILVEKAKAEGEVTF